MPRPARSPQPPAEPGTAQCASCRQHFPLAQLNVLAYGYECATCATAAALREHPAPGDVEHVKVGRGRWWLMPIVVVAVGVFGIFEPVALFLLGPIALYALVLAARIHRTATRLGYPGNPLQRREW